jgi:hypothetical protein
MIKSISLVRRRDGMTRAEFRHYYEAHHAPLGIAWFAFDRYVRNHVADEASDPGFDCLAEFWPRDLAQIEAAFAAAASLFEEDDAKFMSPERRGGRVEEHRLAGPARIVDRPGARKRIDLLRASTLPSLKELAMWAHAEVEAGHATRVVLDLPIADLGNLGDIALLYRWDPAIDDAAPAERLSTAVADICETPAEELLRTPLPGG